MFSYFDTEDNTRIKAFRKVESTDKEDQKFDKNSKVQGSVEIDLINFLIILCDRDFNSENSLTNSAHGVIKCLDDYIKVSHQ